MQDIHNVISSFADPAGVVVVHVGKPPVINGRPGVAPVTLVALANVGHVPAQAGVRTTRLGTDAALSSVERRTFYLQDEVFPVVVDPGGGDAWWIVANGKRFRVDSVEPWTDGGFWVAEGSRLLQDRSLVPVWFGDVPDAPADIFDPEVPKAYAPSRSFRFVIDADDEPDELFVAWPVGTEGPVEDPSFKAIDDTGATVDVTPISVIPQNVGGVFAAVVALLPIITSPDGSLRYEVI